MLRIIRPFILVINFSNTEKVATPCIIKPTLKANAKTPKVTAMSIFVHTTRNWLINRIVMGELIID
jgi:hypothetical protein